MEQQTRAQLSSAKVRTAAFKAGGYVLSTVVQVDEAVVSFKQPDTKVVVEPRRVVVHTAAGHHRRAPGPGLPLLGAGLVVVRAAAANSACQRMCEQGKVLHRRAEDRSGIAAVEGIAARAITVRVAIRVGNEDAFGTHILVEPVGDIPLRAEVH